MRTEFEDNRRELNEGDILKFPGLECTVDECIGKGSNAIVYLGHYADHQMKDLQHRILIKELYPFDGEGKIYRNAEGVLTIGPSAREFYEIHKESYLNGNRFHLCLLADNPGELDSHINTFEYHNTLYSVLEFTGGRSILQELEKETALSLERIVRWMKGILNVLKVFHESGYLHLDISLDNILLTGEGEKERITLIDYNSIVSLEEVHGEGDIILSAKKGYEYAASEILRADRKKIGPWTDLYSVTAVFFHLLFGRGRSVIERKNRFMLPDISQSAALQGQYPIVLDMIARILKKGFEVNPCRRYQSVDQMRTDLNELEERMRCRGITQWALWQKGRDHVINIVRRNTALRYIMEPENIYPLKAQKLNMEEEKKKLISLSDDSFFSEMTGTKPVFLLGSGGMGKTTAMLRIAYDRQKKYTAKSTAVIYISLFGWKNGDRTYIQDKILEDLDFSHEILENARKELRHLLSEPIHTKSGDVPRLLLCLDGLNETSGDISPLLDEIQDIAALSGVKIILSSRSEIAGNEFEKWILLRLGEEEVRAVLKEKQIPEPENMEIMELLHIPMMLSMYIQALDGRKVLKLDNRDELIEEYLSVLSRKEARDPLRSEIQNDDVQNSIVYLGAQVAVKYVLPEIAARIQNKKRSLTEKELYRCVEECYKYLDQKAFTGVFDKWIGHTKDLKLGTKNADEWYGRIVQEILWKKLGLLVKDADNYRISHQILEEYMKQKSDEFHVSFDYEKKRLRNRKRLISAGAAAVAVTLFGLYNFYMSGVLRTQKREAQINESASLAYSSGEKLKQGDRNTALEMALSALPTDGNDRPYVASAEKALADALYVYNDNTYVATHNIKPGAGIWKYAMTKDGTYVVGLDSNGYVRCYDLQSERLVWSYSSAVIKDEDESQDDKVSSMYILEAQNAVLLAGERGETVMLSLDEGKEIWKLDYSELDDEIYGAAEQICLSNDEKILAIGYETRKSNVKTAAEFKNVSTTETDAEFKKISFIDTETGKEISKTDPVPVSLSLYCSFTESGVFSDDDQGYASLLFDMKKRTYHLVQIDPMSGEIIGTAWMKKKDLLNNRSYRQEKLFYIPPDEDYAGGFLVYIYGYDYNITQGYKGTCQLAYLEEEASEWNYDNWYDFELKNDELPELITCGRWNLFLYNDQIIKVDRQKGEQGEGSEKMEEEIVYYSITDELLSLIYANGKTRTLILPDLKEYSLSENNNISDFRIENSLGSHNPDFPFILFPENDTGNMILYEKKSNDSNVQTLSMPDPLGSTLNGRVYILPGEKGFLYLEDESREDEDSVYENRGTVYDVKGNLMEEFRFDTGVHFVVDELQVSEDGKYLISNRYLYDMENHELISMDTLLPENASWSTLRTNAGASGIYSICLDGNQIYIWKEGKEYISGVQYEEEIEIADISSIGSENYTAKDFENINTGKNGVVVLCCTNGEKKETSHLTGTPVDYYLVYFIDDDKWMRIENESEETAFPVLAVADKKTLFAVCDFDRKIRVYDADKGKVLYEYGTNINAESIKDMKFILDDQYLIFWITNGNDSYEYQIMNVENGQIVYRCQMTGYIYNLSVWEDKEQNRIYLFDNESNMNAICIDTENWIEMNVISGLRGVLDSDTFIVQNDYSEVQLIHQYGLEELIRKAGEVLKQVEDSNLK